MSVDIHDGLLALVIIVGILYLLFNLYLVIHMAATMGNKRLMNSRVCIENFLKTFKLLGFKKKKCF